MIKRVWLPVVSVGFLLSTVVWGAPATQDPSSMFDFHSGFWMNLHHFIYADASSLRPPQKGPTLKINQADAETAKRLSPLEQAAWNKFVAYYTANYIQRDQLSDDDLVDIKEKLESAEASPDLKDVGISDELKSLLLQAAPIYRKYWWKQHNQQNKQWVAQLRPLLDQHASQLRRSLERIYDTSWPTEPVRVEAVAYANWAGAYTSIDPTTQVTISTTNAGNQGTAALEIIFHESSHGMMDKLRNAIKDAIATLPADKQKAISMGLWHAVLFYTAGELVAEDYPGYVPYAEQHGLWSRAWPEPIRSLIIQDWKTHMKEAETLNGAVTKLVNDLASSR